MPTQLVYDDAVFYWFPTQTQDATDQGSLGYDGAFLGGMAVVQDTGFGGTHAFDCGTTAQAATVEHGPTPGEAPLFDQDRWSLSAWIKNSGQSGEANTIWGSTGSDNFHVRLRVAFDTEDKLLLAGRKEDNGAAYEIYCVTDSGHLELRDGEWHNIVVLYDSSSVGGDGCSLYADGELLKNSPSFGPFNLNDAGGLYNCLGRTGGNYNDGLVDRLACWHRKLTTTEIADIYAAQRSKPSGGTPSRTYHPLSQGF